MSNISLFFKIFYISFKTNHFIIRYIYLSQNISKYNSISLYISFHRFIYHFIILYNSVYHFITKLFILYLNIFLYTFFICGSYQLPRTKRKHPFTENGFCLICVSKASEIHFPEPLRKVFACKANAFR